MKPITENHIETFAIETLQSIGWGYRHGFAIAPGAEQAERENFEQIILIGRLRKAIANATIDWMNRESTRARLIVIVTDIYQMGLTSGQASKGN